MMFCLDTLIAGGQHFLGSRRISRCTMPQPFHPYWPGLGGLDIIMFVCIPIATLLLMSGEVAAVVKADPTIIAHSFSLSLCLQEFIIIGTFPSQTPLLHLARLALVRFRT